MEKTPKLTLVQTEDTELSPPLARLEAEAMLDAVAFARSRAAQLPEESALRQEWLGSADRYALCAQLLWPTAAQLFVARQ